MKKKKPKRGSKPANTNWHDSEARAAKNTQDLERLQTCEALGLSWLGKDDRYAYKLFKEANELRERLNIKNFVWPETANSGAKS